MLTDYSPREVVVQLVIRYFLLTDSLTKCLVLQSSSSFFILLKWFLRDPLRKILPYS